jgi:hypothetical protein
MPWTRNLPMPIVLNDGRTLATLADARSVMQSLPTPHQWREHWLRAGGFMREVAIGNGPIDVVPSRLTQALRLEGLI